MEFVLFSIENRATQLGICFVGWTAKDIFDDIGRGPHSTTLKLTDPKVITEPEARKLRFEYFDLGITMIGRGVTSFPLQALIT